MISLIDKACSVKMAQSLLVSSFFCLFMDRDSVSVHKQAEKELGQYPIMLTSRLVWTVRTCPGCSDHMAHTSSNAADIDARSNYAHFTYVTLMTNTFNASTWKSNLRCGLFKLSIRPKGVLGFGISITSKNVLKPKKVNSDAFCHKIKL